jgi:hypothetical protein
MRGNSALLKSGGHLGTDPADCRYFLDQLRDTIGVRIFGRRITLNQCIFSLHGITVLKMGDLTLRGWRGVTFAIL